MLLNDVRILENIEIISESKSPQGMKIRGLFQRADEENNNKRVYPKTVLESQVKGLQDMIKENRLCGELDHPSHDIVKLSNASHLITGLYMEGNDVIGEAKVLDTPAGKVAQALIEGGVKIGISSRGVGTLSEDTMRKVKYVNDDYKLVTFDLVADPSTRGAFPALSESTESGEKTRKIVNDTYKKALGEKVFVTMLKESFNTSLQETDRPYETEDTSYEEVMKMRGYPSVDDVLSRGKVKEDPFYKAMMAAVKGATPVKAKEASKKEQVLARLRSGDTSVTTPNKEYQLYKKHSEKKPEALLGLRPVRPEWLGTDEERMKAKMSPESIKAAMLRFSASEAKKSKKKKKVDSGTKKKINDSTKPTYDRIIDILSEATPGKGVAFSEGSRSWYVRGRKQQRKAQGLSPGRVAAIARQKAARQPRQQTGTALVPRPGTALVPRPGTDVVPRPGTALVPRPGTDVVPRPGTAVGHPRGGMGQEEIKDAEYTVKDTTPKLTGGSSQPPPQPPPSSGGGRDFSGGRRDRPLRGFAGMLGRAAGTLSKWKRQFAQRFNLGHSKAGGSAQSSVRFNPRGARAGHDPAWAQKGTHKLGADMGRESDDIAAQAQRKKHDTQMGQMKRERDAHLWDPDRRMPERRLAAHTQPTYNKMAEFLEEAYIYKK